MLDGDGTRESRKGEINRRRLYCDTEREAKLFQALACVAGNASNATYRDMRRYVGTYSSKSPHMKNIPNSVGYWCVTILTRKTVQIYDRHKKLIENSKQLVW